MKVLIISDGKYGDRAIDVIKKKFPSAELLIIKEENPTMFLDEVFLEKEVEDEIERADLLILYVRHPDVVFEICTRQKPTILPIHFGDGFFNQVKASNTKLIQPTSMCNALPNTGIKEIDNFFKVFGTPTYKIKIDYSENNQPIFTNVELVRESPCGSSINTLKFLHGKFVNPETLNEFALSVRQECREPMSVIFNREMADTASIIHLSELIKVIVENYHLDNKEFVEYITKFRKDKQT